MIKKIFGHFFSILFLPLLLPLFGALFVIYSDPYGFPDQGANILMLIRVGLLTFLFPAITIFLLVRLKFVQNVTVYERQERTIPYIACGFFYIWAFYVFYKEGFNSHITFILLGATIAVFIDFLINILVVKVSMHTTGAGGLVAFMLVLFPYAQINVLPVLLASIVIAGCVGAARLALKAHSEREVYLGYLTGFFSFMVASNFIHL
ncbi:MAG TPA: hypothetical protein PKC38_01740 [Chitinophagales bacterium]|nr:hypothetical protein [Chitinophagales bacterium]